MPMPFARAMRMYSLLSASSIASLVCLAMPAIPPIASAATGRTRDCAHGPAPLASGT